MTTFSKIATKGKLTLGLVFPIEAYTGSIAKMENQEQLAKRAEELGFKALWFRDIPFNDPNFGDAGQLYDPWIYMTHIMNHTKEIALATGSIILPLRHPVHTVKSINSLQILSNERLVLGVASGDRPVEYPAFNQLLENKSELFRDSFHYIKALQGNFPHYTSKFYGNTNGGIDLLPKYYKKTPMLVTGHSGQSLNWIAEHSDGWLYYPTDFKTLQLVMQQWREALSKNEEDWKPFMQSIYVDITKDSYAKPTPIHLGLKTGAEYLNSHLKLLESYGVNHVMLNLKYGTRSAEEMIEEIGEKVVPKFF
ncbi:TIGR03571 family LLM class oxidoreductase [Pedobacter petrophilus]|uniref:TIGR03571 family LLM class oxidoreductase n=1 Tax=Pedobacter petrophilus TaxID=1908241 RepID=A0A7K0G672_9SPHI|nr:LLM class oxidoreductase [Pedobacter petrophilus]MRX78844.1 TIGR03571 family LLM class oxidoreductase [Pedobacter petrophilus]